MFNAIIRSQCLHRISHFKNTILEPSNNIHILQKSQKDVAGSIPPFKYKIILSNRKFSEISVGHFANDGDKDVPEKERFIHKTEVERFIVDCMMKVGAEQFRAKMLAANLTEADYVGHFSHGLNRLNVYVKDCQGKFCQPNNDPVVLKKSPGTAWVDGNNGLGVVVGTFCMNQAIEMAKQSGIGWVVAKGSNHFGICQW